jgi:flagellar FliJ protein
MYRFNLESLLNYRRYQEDILQKELSDFKNQLVQHEQKLHQLKQDWRKYSRELRQQQQKGGTVSGLIMYFRYLDRLSMDIDNQKRLIAKAKKQFDRKRRELIEIVKKRKTLDRLKEKGCLTYQREMMRKEQNLMDEAAATRYRGQS